MSDLLLLQGKTQRCIETIRMDGEQVNAFGKRPVECNSFVKHSIYRSGASCINYLAQHISNFKHHCVICRIV